MKKTNLCILTIIGLLSLSFTSNLESTSNTINLNSVTEEDNTIFISNKDQLLEEINKCYIDSYSKNKTFNIVNDIDFQGESIPSINIFSGKLNGNNYKIYNFNLDNSKNGKEVGFVRKLTKDGIIKNLKVEYDLSLNSKDSVCGGLVGYNLGTILNSVYTGNLKSNANLGGIVGYNEKDAKIENCLNNGEIISPNNTAGIAGVNKGTILNSINKGTINETRFSSSDEIKSSNIGGIAGNNSGSILNSINEGSIGTKQVGNNVGGIAGNSSGSIEYCQNKGNIKGKINTAGISGTYNSERNTNSLQYCYNEGSIYGENSVGGIIGTFTSDAISDIKYCHNQGNIVGNKEYIGGIVGNQTKGNIKESFNSAIINGNSSNYVGGIVGYSTGGVLNCFAINDIRGNDYLGGIAGEVKKLQNSYSIANINVDGNYIGALAGFIENINDVTNNYYIYSGISAIDNIDYLDKAQRINKEKLASKDNLNVNLDNDYWMVSDINKSLPFLKNIKNNLLDNETVKLIKNKLESVTRFGSYVKFIDEDGKILKDIFVEYDGNLDTSMIPEVPQKENYFASWEKFDTNNIKNNIYVNPVYNSLITSIASEKGPNPNLIIVGKFYDTTKVNITKVDDSLKHNKYNYLGTYKINVVDEVNEINKENLKYKIKLKDSKDNKHIAIYNGNELKFLDSYIDGNYICFNGNDINEIILLSDKFVSLSNPVFVTTIILSTLGAIALLIAIILIAKNISKKKKK